MARLNINQVKALRTAGRHPVGDGLLLNITAAGSRSWLLRVQSNGRRRDFGLGSCATVSLAEAHEAARDYRRKLRAGICPLEAKRAQVAIPTFAHAAVLVHGEHKAGWRNSKHGAQWLSTLETYAFPRIGTLRVDAIDTGHVRDVLADIWLAKPETARRVRQRIGTVLDYAVGKNWRTAPLAMTAVNRALPKQSRKVGSFTAMPYADVPAFLPSILEKSSGGRLALAALILTAARSGEIRGARWDELDLEAGTWTVPAERMKAGKAHTVPLSPAARDVLARAAALRIAGNDLIFPGATRGRPLSDMTLLKVLRDMGLGMTVHGFRSSFRDWCAEQTSFPGEVAEAALAHSNHNKVEAAYRRTDYLEKRRALMDAWGAYCTGGGAAKVVRLVASA